MIACGKARGSLSRSARRPQAQHTAVRSSVTIEAMFRAVALSAFALLCFAQTPPKSQNDPPAEVDQALRARITQFYQYLVDGKYRQAEALVAEDTKDLFYDNAKPKYQGFEIQHIEYADNYTRAQVTVQVQQVIFMGEIGNMNVKLGSSGSWKVENGQWCWYVDPHAPLATPWGKVETETAAPGAAPTPPPFKMPTLQDALRDLYSQVKADKQSLTLKPGEPQEVTITNGAPGPINLSLYSSTTGVEVKIDRTQLKAGEKAIVTFRASDTARNGTLNIQVDQTNQIIPIQVNIN
jgi:hypothetical protein